jgi:26S proteasome regulatory subunit T2
MAVGMMEEIIDNDHAIISKASGPESHLFIMTYVDNDLLESGCQACISKAVVGDLATGNQGTTFSCNFRKSSTYQSAVYRGQERRYWRKL